MKAVSAPVERTMQVRVISADPSVKKNRAPLTSVVDIPAESLDPGPRGYRLHVIDYDASSQHLYAPAKPERWLDPVTDAMVQTDPAFHARNVYAIVMRTLARFEFALGRRIAWGFDDPGHQLKVAPHAFSDSNAFYSRRDEALMFGYFPSRTPGENVFTCLSHDVVVHETSHALLDGLRERYVVPSSPGQAAFHEGFGDIVALLSVFSLKELVLHGMDLADSEGELEPKKRKDVPADAIGREYTTKAWLKRSMLFSIGRQIGMEMSMIGRSALRHSAEVLEPSPRHLEERTSAHDLGEVLVAAVIDAFVGVWAERLKEYFRDERADYVGRERAAEEGAEAADYLLTMVIRALDYCPPVHVTFDTFLSAMITADEQIRPADKYGFRRHLLESFKAYGIEFTDEEVVVLPGGAWKRFTSVPDVSVERVRFSSLQHDLDEVFRFVWENRKQLGLFDGAYTRVLSVRRCMRIAPEDGFPLQETVAEVLQQVRMPVRELARWKVRAPEGLSPDVQVMLYGGMTLVFDEFGKLKLKIGTGVLDPSRKLVGELQTQRLASLWARGAIRNGKVVTRPLSQIHRLRSAAIPHYNAEAW